MRLLGGILRPSLYQVTCGCGKLRIRGAVITAPSPWEMDWARSPSSKLPMTAGKQKYQKLNLQTKGEYTQKSYIIYIQLFFPFQKNNQPSLPSVLWPSAFSSAVLHRAALIESALELPWFPQWIKKGYKELGCNHSPRDTGGTPNWFIFVILQCESKEGNRSW